MSQIHDDLTHFLDYAKTLSGDEKGEAQVFCDRLFQAFFAFSTAIYLLELPGPIQDALFKMLSIAGIIANTLLLIRTIVRLSFASRVVSWCR